MYEHFNTRYCAIFRPTLSISFVQGWYRKGAALVALSRHEEAALAFRKGLECEPDNEDLKNKLADAEREAKYAPKRYKEDGVSAQTEAIERSPLMM